jgi:hypothetical protein
MAAYDFTKELEAFSEKKEELLRVCEGKYAVFHKNEFLGVFDTHKAAYENGLSKWGNVPFLIKQVLKEEPVESMPALCLGLVHARI